MHVRIKEGLQIYICFIRYWCSAGGVYSNLCAGNVRKR